MKKSMLLAALLVVGASSDSKLPRGLVGFSSATTDLTVGFLAMTKMCQADFPTSRICTVTEMQATQVVPNLASGENAVLLYGDAKTPCANTTWAFVDSTGILFCGGGQPWHVACCAGQPELLGDVDGNGKLNLADVTLL